MDTPIACTLDAAEHRSRTAALSTLAERALRSRARTDHGERLTFEHSDRIARELEAAVAAEAACCPFLRMDLQRDGDRVVLDISGPAEARPVIAALFA
jgi:hypothetical protein